MSHLFEAFPPPEVPQANFRLKSVVGLGRAIWITMVVTGVVYLITLMLYAEVESYYAKGESDGYLSTSQLSAAADVEKAAGYGWLLSALLNVGLFVLLIIFLFKAIGEIKSKGHRVSMARGLAIGGWFIPLANSILSYLFFVDLARYRKPEIRRVMWLLNFWWWSWVIGIPVFAFTGNGMIRDAESFSAGLDGARYLIGGFGLGAIGLLFGAIFFAKVSRGPTSQAEVFLGGDLPPR